MSDNKIIEPENEQFQVIIDWLKGLGFTHSIALQLPVCIKTPMFYRTKQYVGMFMCEFEKALIYKKDINKKQTKKDSNEWKRSFLDFLIFFENHKDSYSSYHCHILLNATKRNGLTYTDEEISKALEYAQHKFATYLLEVENEDLIDEDACFRHMFPDCQFRKILSKDNIYGYDLKEFICHNKITDPDRLEDGRVLLGINIKPRSKKKIPQPEKTKDVMTRQTEIKPITTSVPAGTKKENKPDNKTQNKKTKNKLARLFSGVYKSFTKMFGFRSHRTE